MFGIREDVEWRFAVGRQLLQVGIGQYQVVLRFDGELTISIEGDFEHVASDQGVVSQGELPQRAAGLVSLLGSTVQAIRAEDAKTLWIAFSGGHGLRLYDSKPNYESFQITAPGIHIVV